MVYNSQANELLALGIDKRVTYWSVNDRKMTKQLQKMQMKTSKKRLPMAKLKMMPS